MKHPFKMLGGMINNVIQQFMTASTAPLLDKKSSGSFAFCLLHLNNATVLEVQEQGETELVLLLGR